jgi:uncharacterized protein YqeY
MNTIEKRIDTDYIKAFKERNAEVKMLLSTVKGEMQTYKKNIMVDTLSDDEAIKILDKFSKNLKETIQITNDEKCKRELSIIEDYLPRQLTESEINEKIDEAITNGAKNFGEVMKMISKFPLDKKIASELVKSKF